MATIKTLYDPACNWHCGNPALGTVAQNMWMPLGDYPTPTSGPMLLSVEQLDGEGNILHSVVPAWGHETGPVDWDGKPWAERATITHWRAFPEPATQKD